MNKIILMGRTTIDPQMKNGSGENPLLIGRFGIAVDRRRKKEGEPTADFFNCLVFGKQAEFVEKYIKKGTKILITGHVENYQYVKKDGQQGFGSNVIVSEIEFAESKKDSENAKPVESKVDENGFMNIPDGMDEELPFM